LDAKSIDGNSLESKATFY